MKKISFVMVMRNEANNVEKCIGGIYKQKGDWEREVVIVDSSSDDDTIKLAKQWPVKVHTIPRKEFHHGRTRNLGASLATGDVLVYLGGDAWPASDRWLEELVSPLSDENVACVYGRQSPKKDCDPINKFRTEFNYGPERIDKHISLQHKLAHRLYFFSTVNCAIRREIWEKFKFPEDIHIFEDAAFARKVIGAGHKIVYSPGAEVIHSHNIGAKEILSRYIDAGYMQAKYSFSEKQSKSYQSEGSRYFKQGFKQIYEEAGLPWGARFFWHTAAGFIGLTWGQLLFKMGQSGIHYSASHYKKRSDQSR
ncbi:MAG TPA: glycosyltransferase family 2 protein [Verrucomicrobiae bacterium]